MSNAKVDDPNRTYGPIGAAKELFYCRDPEILLEGPAGCVAAETRLFDPISGKHPTILELFDRGERPTVLTMNGPRLATVPFRKGFAKLFEILTDDGRSCVVTADHKLLTPNGWAKAGRLSPGCLIGLSVSPALLPSSSGTCLSTSPTSAWNCSGKDQGCRDGCSTSPRRGGEQLPSDRAYARSLTPSQFDVPGRTHGDSSEDDPDCESGRSRPYRPSVRPSTQGCFRPIGREAFARDSFGTEKPSRSFCSSRSSLQCSSTMPRRETSFQRVPDSGDTLLRDLRRDESLPSLVCEESSSRCGPSILEPESDDLDGGKDGQFRIADLRSDDGNPSSNSLLNLDSRVRWGTVSSIKYVRDDFYYDLHVPVEEHYLAEGIWHHNTGKSRALLEKINLCLLKYPGSRALIVRKTRVSMSESVLVTFEEKVLPANSPIASNSVRRVRTVYDYPNGSALVIGGMDNPDRIMSTEFDIVAAFEATELIEDDWEKLTTRLRNSVMPYQQAIADCNPAGPHHWLNQRANRGGMTRLLSRHQDNPTLWDANAGDWTEDGKRYVGRLGQLTGSRLLRLLAGKWAATEGVVYEGYDAATHVIDPFPIPKSWNRYRSIDFGFTNPFLCQFWAEDPDGRLYLYRELYKTKTLVEDHAKTIHTLSDGERYVVTLADHDAEDRATLSRHGIETTAAFKAVESGIQAVAERLKKAGDGKPRLFLFRNALVGRDEALVQSKRPVCTEEEFDGYVYPKGADGKTLKEEPVKLHDHGMDAMRYLVAYVDDVGKEKFEVNDNFYYGGYLNGVALKN